MPKRNILWMLAVVAVALGTAWWMKGTPQARRQQNVRSDTMVDAYNKILQNHYPAVDPLELKRSAIAGMVKALDPQSIYISHDKAEAFQKRMKGQTFGTGLVLEPSSRGPVIASVHPNSPGDQAGLIAGDAVVRINGVTTFNMSIEQAGRLLSEGVDGDVKLRVISARDPGVQREVTLAMEEYPVEIVTGLYRDAEGRWAYAVDREERLVYIRVTEFVEGTVDRFKQAYRATLRARGLVLDLRGNPGGHLPEAVRLANLFLHNEPIVTVLGNGGRVEKHVAHAEGTYPDNISVVVLIDADTASAAEIVAGALSGADRAILVGTPSRGKHSVQTPLPLGGKLGLLHLTTARFYFGPDTPEPATRPARDTAGPQASKPIAPHVFVPYDPNMRRELQILRRRAAGGPSSTSTMPATRPAADPDAALGRKLVRDDVQLAAAVELLKNPEKIHAILQAYAEARKKRPTTQPSR
jgi:carboxyl-terminal processing protease